MNYLIKFFSFSFIFISYFILCANEILTKAQKNINFNLKSKIENFSKNSINFDFAKFAFFLKGRNDKILYDEVNELFPHTKNIILSSNTIPNYSKGETLYFSFETKKEIETKISSRIVNIIDNKGITNIEMYHEYYTIIGGNININQECFNIDNTIYDSSSKNLMISAYSFYGINITLYNENQEIIETKIITNWNYIIINPQITKSICYFPISSNSLSGVFFQLIDYNTLDKNQNQIKISDSLLKKIFYKKRIISDDELEETEEENPEIEDKFEEETENEEETEDDIEEIEDDIEETEDEKETKYEFEEEEDENIEREIEIEEIEDDIAEEEEMEDQNNELEEQIIDSEEKIEYESLIEDENEPDENEEFEDENEEQNNGNYPISYNPMNDIIFSFPKDKEDKKNYGWVIGVVIGVVVVAVGVVLFVFRKKIFGKDRNDYKRAREFTHEHDEKDMKEVEIEN